MKITIEMMFKTGSGKVKCSENVDVGRNYNKEVVAHKAVMDRRKEFIGNAEIIQVKAADEDVTEQVLEIDEEYYKNEFYRLDDEIPF